MVHSNKAGHSRWNVVLILAGMWILLAVQLGCQLQTQEKRIVVEGRLEGQDGAFQPVDPTVLRLTHQQDEVRPRLVFLEGGGMQHLQKLTLEAVESTGLPFAEEFFLVSLSRAANRPGVPEPFQYRTNRPGWLLNHVGDLAVLPIRKDDVSLPTNEFNDFPAAQLRPAGGTYLARIENDDRHFPWFISTADSARCVNLPLNLTLMAPPNGEATDCFDMQTLCGMFLTNFAVATTVAVTDLNLPLVQVSVGNHRLYVVPHMTFGPDSTVGFGMIYAVNVAGNLGANLARAVVYVPISLHFRIGASTTEFDIFVDPLSGLGSTPSENINRVTIAYNGVFGGIMAENLQSAITSTLSSFTLPPTAIGSTEEVLALGFSLAAPSPGSIPLNDHSVIARPVQRSTVGQTISNLALNLPGVTVTNLPGTPAPIAPSVLADGSVTLRQNFGGTMRDITIAPVQTANEFEVYFLY